MKTLHFFKLIRWQNLLLIALTQAFFFFFVIRDSFPIDLLTLEIPEFLLLLTGTLLIAASGNIINDLYDSYADSINKPKKINVLEGFSEKAIINTYYLMNFLALIIGMYFTITTGNYNVISVFILSAGLLWFYNISLKALPLIGNLVIGILCGLTIIIIFLAEPIFFTSEIYDLPISENVERILYLMSGYAIFAVWLTLIREMIKDLQDRKGDDEAGYKTLAVVMGSKLKFIIVALILVLIVSLIIITMQLYNVNALFHAYYIGLSLILPSALLAVLITIASSAAQLRICGIIAKIIMMFGIVSMPVFSYFNSL